MVESKPVFNKEFFIKPIYIYIYISPPSLTGLQCLSIVGLSALMSRTFWMTLVFIHYDWGRYYSMHQCFFSFSKKLSCHLFDVKNIKKKLKDKLNLRFVSHLIHPYLFFFSQLMNIVICIFFLEFFTFLIHTSLLNKDYKNNYNDFDSSILFKQMIKFF